MRFKCVSKTWQSIILNPSFAGAHRDRGGFKGILIAERRMLSLDKTDFFHVNLANNQLYYHSSLDQSRRFHQPPLSFSDDIVGDLITSLTDTVNGLVCFYYVNHSFWYNLATRESMDLPISSNAAVCRYHFVLDPINKLYKLLKMCPIYYYDDGTVVDDLSCEILTIGLDSSWRSIPHAPKKINSRSICFNGVLYWIVFGGMDQHQHLIAFHLAQEKFESIFIESIFIPRVGGGFRLQRFGPNLALAVTYSLPSDIDYDEALIVSWCSNGSGGGGGEESGMWAEPHRIKVPKESRQDFIFSNPVGMLPNGKVLILSDAMKMRCPFPFYLYDQTKGELETIEITSKSTSFFYIPILPNLRYLYGYLTYHQDNIIPLSRLASHVSS